MWKAVEKSVTWNVSLTSYDIIGEVSEELNLKKSTVVDLIIKKYAYVFRDDFKDKYDEYLKN